MTSKQLQSVTAIISRREARESYRPKGWRETILDMLRADAMNALSPALRRRRPVSDCN